MLLGKHKLLDSFRFPLYVFIVFFVVCLLCVVLFCFFLFFFCLFFWFVSFLFFVCFFDKINYFPFSNECRVLDIISLCVKEPVYKILCV